MGDCYRHMQMDFRWPTHAKARIFELDFAALELRLRLYTIFCMIKEWLISSQSSSEVVP